MKIVFPVEISIQFYRLRRSAFTNTCGYHPIYQGPEENKRWNKGKLLSRQSWDIHFLLVDIGAPGSQAFKLRLELIPFIPLVLSPPDSD